MATSNFGDRLTNFLELMETIKRTLQTVKAMFLTHETTQRRILEQHSYWRCCDIVSNGYNIIPTLQRCFARKVIVTNRPV